jgi:hypothetical protein
MAKYVKSFAGWFQTKGHPTNARLVSWRHMASLLPAMTTASGRATLEGSADPACIFGRILSQALLANVNRYPKGN